MQTVVVNAQVEISIPDMVEPLEMDQEMYVKRPRLKMKLCLEVTNLTLREPGGRTITIPRLIIERLAGTILPVIDGDNIVMFKVDEADNPTVVEG